jgi:hypothetical protein
LEGSPQPYLSIRRGIDRLDQHQCRSMRHTLTPALQFATESGRSYVQSGRPKKCRSNRILTGRFRRDRSFKQPEKRCRDRQLTAKNGHWRSNRPVTQITDNLSSRSTSVNNRRGVRRRT